MQRRYDVVVIGAGAVGLALARQLARAGRSVAVVERDPLGSLASRAAAGMLAPQVEARAPDAFFDLALAGRERFDALAGELEAETGLALDYRRDGLLALAFDLDGESDLARRVEWQRAAGLDVEELTRAEAAKRWPALELPAPGGMEEALRFAEGRVFHFPGEAQVDAGRLVDALLAACGSAGADVLRGVEARGFSTAGDRIVSVRLEQGELACELAVNAAGAWAGRVAGWIGEALPVEPVRGEMVAFATGFRQPRPIVSSGEAYCLLREGGDLLVGATAERAGYAASLTADGQAWLERSAVALVPSLAGRRPSARWVGLRPGTPDDLPILGFSNEARGLYHATGHYRNGVLLAPITAELAFADLEGVAAAPVMEAFSPARFTTRTAIPG